jgi:alcohol dehydrogenase YqhD (iron-dependent ADH family)
LKDFTFHIPTEVVFGRGTERQAAELVKKHGGTKVLLVSGGHSAEKSGLLGRIRQDLTAAGIPFESLSGVQPNPRLSLAEKGVEIVLKNGIDFILAVGGGSVIDTAKGIAIGAANPGTPIWDFWSQKVPVTKSLPVGVILTIPAAGSEMSDSAVLTNDTIHQKRGLSTQWNRPKFAIMNPELTLTLPVYQVACGVADIMMHTMERYFSPVVGNELTDAIAVALLRTVIHNGKIAVGDPHNYDAMSELMWAGSLSHNNLTGLGGIKDFATHQLGHELSATFNVAHGASLTSVWGSWAKYCMPHNPERFASFAEGVWQITEGSTEEKALRGIEKTVDYFRSIGMPVCLSELGVGIQSEEELRGLADRCVFHGTRTIGQFLKLDGEDCYRIYKDANH